MNKKILVFTFFALIGVFNLFLVDSVKAYEETVFTGNECLTEDIWTDTAKTEYKLEQSTGKFEISGSTAREYEQPSGSVMEAKYIFYQASEDGKTLTAYVPNYNSIIKVEGLKTIVSTAGIDVTANCAGTLKVTKTVTGNAPREDSNIPNQTDPSNFSESNTVDKVSAPNTANPASVAAIVVGIVMVLVAAYVLLKKNNKLPFVKNN